MVNKTIMIGSLVTAGFLWGIASGEGVAQESHPGMQHSTPEQTGSFQQLDQPLWVKGAVTAGGLGLIGLELWWFLFSQPKSRKATTQGDVQEITVTVDGGYEPSQIVVQAGQRVRLNFDRQDPSSCLEEVRFPEFRIAQDLPLHQTTAIEFTPDKPGRYEFTCGMNMFRGVVEVQAAESIAPPLPLPHPTDHAIVPAIAPAPSVTATLTPEGTQAATVTVAKGYQPQRVIVAAGYPVRLQFERQNPSSCYDQLLIPEFAIAVDLTPDATTTVEFTPEQPGEYEFMCGMKMNRGVIEVRAASDSSSGKAMTQISL